MNATGEERVAPKSVFAIAGLLVVVCVGVVSTGTLVESRWTGSMASCSRVTDKDNSTFQNGRASMRWLPPLIHCHFENTTSGPLSVRELPSADKNHFALVGVAFAGLVALCLSLLAGLVVASARLVYRRRRPPPTPAAFVHAGVKAPERLS
jgi:hypothetical protein